MPPGDTASAGWPPATKPQDPAWEHLWDEGKAASNFLKHRVSFVRTSFAFRDIASVEIVDRRQDYGEERVLLIGMERGELLAVVYTERGTKIRIISARRAEAHERQYYQRQNTR